MKTVTITEEQMEKVFQHLSIVKDINDSFKKDEDQLMYQKSLSEFCGIYGVICDLGIEDEWYKWQTEQIRRESLNG